MERCWKCDRKREDRCRLCGRCRECHDDTLACPGDVRMMRERIKDLAHNQLRIALLSMADGKELSEALSIAKTFPPRV